LSPILVRPVREQLEHDKVIRLLQAKYKRKHDARINPGAQQDAPVGSGPMPLFPDVVLHENDSSKKVAGVVEVETSESVNHLEASYQWAGFGRLRVPFHLYVPAASVEGARRLCTELQIPVAELWAYHAVGEEIRFTLILRAAQPAETKSRASTTGRRAARTRPAAAARKAPARKAATPRKAASGRRTTAARSARRSGAAKKATSSRATRATGAAAKKRPAATRAAKIRRGATKRK